MPNQNAIRKVRATPEVAIVSNLATEKESEDLITARLRMIFSGLLLIDRYVMTVSYKVSELLAIKMPLKTFSKLISELNLAR